jgi:hypothetical protein
LEGKTNDLLINIKEIDQYYLLQVVDAFLFAPCSLLFLNVSTKLGNLTTTDVE